MCLCTFIDSVKGRSLLEHTLVSRFLIQPGDLQLYSRIYSIQIRKEVQQQRELLFIGQIDV